MKYLEGLVKELAEFGIRPELVSYGNEQLGSDVAMPCFAFAKEQSKSPQAIAEEISGAISHPSVERAEAIAGYVNIWVKPTELAKGLIAQGVDQDNYGSQTKNDQTVIIDYVAPNLAKPLSIGHLRNALQGRALTNLYKSQGYKVVTDNHLGDWGTVFGMWVVGFQKFSNKEKLDTGGNKELGRVYVQMRNALKTEEDQGKDELKSLVQQWLIKLEAGDKEAWEYHELFKEVSLSDVSRVLKKLDIIFDENLGEAFYYQQARNLIDELIKDGTAIKQDDNSIIVDLSSESIKTPLLLQKSNGALLYASSDIATIKYRDDRWQPEQVVYVVGAEQQFHFKQLFAFNKIAKYSNASLIHHWYGLVEELDEQGNRKKMSSRKGAIYLEEVLEKALEKAKEQAREDMSDQDIEKIAYGAVTFREFLQGHQSNVLFDWDEMFSLTGKSGPYVQYGVVRMSSLLDKASVEPKFNDSYDWQAERVLLNILLKYPSIEREALEELEPSKLAFYAYGLAKELNRYYESTTILDENDDIQAARLWLIARLKQNMEHSLGLLGMKMPTKM